MSHPRSHSQVVASSRQSRDSVKDTATCVPCPDAELPPLPRLSIETTRTLEVDSAHTSPKTSAASSATLISISQDKEDRSQLSTTRLLFAHVGAALTLFLATTDATIVSTILPTISLEFKASQNEYTWVSVVYMLTQTAFQPLYGKLSDLVGRRTVLYSSMLIFTVGSALCGAAQSAKMLIFSRAIAGVGGGGIVSLVWTITSELVDIQNQAKWSQALSVTWACSAVAGPLLGGLFSGETGTLSWRWAFLLNLPICAAAFVVLYFSLQSVRIGTAGGTTWHAFLHTFDFLGLILFMSGSSCIVIGLNIATNLRVDEIATISLILVGVVVLACGGIYETRTSRDALFPPVAFRDLTIVIVLCVIFLHNFAFNAGTFYLALYFQGVNGFSPLKAGLAMLPYSLGSSLASMPTAWFIGYWQKRKMDTSAQKLVTCLGLVIACTGFGIMMLLGTQTPRILQSFYILLAGVGIGMLFHAPYQIFTRALRRKDMASGTSAFFLVRFTGATVGLAVAGAIYQAELTERLPAGISASNVLQYLNTSLPQEFRPEILNALALSLKTIWMVCCPFLGVALLVSDSRYIASCLLD
ncbi:amino acid permease ScVBA-like protein [Obba rivulosa]|uniref:Amino acid permease ScVBA-like protein n=1 Tax=Obba rivulosa TaxID=1052685 RepID=A0A8E2DVX2_9APHY|nr:amino acid permease ScVBA-like protein [Obba rivulosa]